MAAQGPLSASARNKILQQKEHQVLTCRLLPREAKRAPSLCSFKECAHIARVAEVFVTSPQCKLGDNCGCRLGCYRRAPLGHHRCEDFMQALVVVVGELDELREPTLEAGI